LKVTRRLETGEKKTMKSLPSAMAAVVLTGHGDLDKLVYREDFPVPVPAPGEVLIEVAACGLNNTDVWVRQGAYGTDDNPNAVASWRRSASEETLSFPRIQGTDSVGRIVAVGGDVSADRIGQRVMVDFSIYNDEGDSLADIDYIGHGRNGGFAEYLTVPDENAHLVDNDLSDSELATFCCAYLTGEHMLDRANVQAGERVLITGASGGVGSGLIQLCRARGAIPYGLTSRVKLEAVKALGAQGVIDRDSPNLIEAAHHALEDHAVDVVADLVGGTLFNPLLQLLRPEGRYTTAGAIGGPVVELDLRTVYLKHLAIHGSSQGTRGAFKRLMHYINTGKIKPILDRQFKLSDFHQAQAYFMEKHFVGKVVVVPDAKWADRTST
tara:strand:- start:117 stop:1262 length:1146 start_codon:yes stop_codon:yes gene_type:complete